MTTTWFFERLGIAPTHDLRTIKRAYAVVLKTIDQDAERETFESLRGAYEAALAWARRADADDEHEDEDDERDAPAPAAPPRTAASGPQHDEQEADAPLHGQAPSVPLSDAQPPRHDNGQTLPPSGSLPPARSADELADRLSRTTGLDIRLDGLGGIPPDDGDDTHDDDLDAPPDEPEDVPDARDDESWEAIDEWVERLLAADPGRAEAGLAQALADPRLGHLDSQANLEAALADAMHLAPEGHAALFDAASERFAWGERSTAFRGDRATAGWISRVVNQGLQWQEQARLTLAAQSAALKAAQTTAAPSRRKAYLYAPSLGVMAEEYPDWLTLRLPAGRVQAWQRAYHGLSKGWLRLARVRDYYFADRRKSPGRLAVIFILFFVVQGLVRGIYGGATGDTSRASDTVRIAAPAEPAADEPVLAYEFTGPITRDSCESAHDFVHTSNWLEVDDPGAIALLTTRALLCQQMKQWPQADDTLLDCLRDERIAALTARRPEAAARCTATPGTASPAKP